MSDFENWARKPETKARLALSKKNAWEQFTKQFPNADKNQFNVETRVDEKYRITSEVFFDEGEGSSVSVFGSDRKYWSQKMKKALGVIGEGRLSLSAIATENKNRITNPGSRFHRARAKHCQNLQSGEQNLCNARRIFRDKISRHISANQAQTHSIG